jgi:hypothetical protein
MDNPSSKTSSYQHDLFSLDKGTPSTSSRKPAPEFNSFHESLDCRALGKFIRGRNNNKRPRTDDAEFVPSDRRPITFVRFNTRLGKAKAVTLKALLDSGGGGYLVDEKFCKHLRVKDMQFSKQVWTTPSGTLMTSKKVKSRFTIPDLHDNRLIEWDVHVTKSLGVHDMILGRDLLEFLGIDVKISDMTVEWGMASMPFKEYNSNAAESYHINNPVNVEERTQRVKEILEAKYVPAKRSAVAVLTYR